MVKQLLRKVRSRSESMKRNIALFKAGPERAARQAAAVAYLRNESSARATDPVTQQFRDTGQAPWALRESGKRELLTAYDRMTKDPSLSAAGDIVSATQKQFFTETLTTSALRNLPAFIDTALEPSLLETMVAMSGMIVHLESVEILVSRPSPNGLSASQLWHRDVNDKVILKLFVYLNDVEEQNGPFTYIEATPSARVPRDGDHYMPDPFIDRSVARDEWRCVKGPAGTAFLIDTGRCLHFGSRCSQPRIAYISTYSSGLKFMKRSRDWAGVLGERAKALSPLQRVVCGLDSVGSFSYATRSLR